MYIRIIASIFDYILFFFLFTYISEFNNYMESIFYMPSDLFIFIYFFLYFFFLESIFKTSLGKWVFNLKLQTSKNFDLPRHKYILRSIYKFVTIITFYGAFYNCYKIIKTGESWYDDRLDIYLIKICNK